jgi:hypothetical protein
MKQTQRPKHRAVSAASAAKAKAKARAAIQLGTTRFLSSETLAEAMAKAARQQQRNTLRILSRVAADKPLGKLDATTFAKMEERFPRYMQSAAGVFTAKHAKAGLAALARGWGLGGSTDCLRMMAAALTPKIDKQNFCENFVKQRLARLLAPLGAKVVKLAANGKDALFVTGEHGVARGREQAAEGAHSLDFAFVLRLNTAEEMLVVISHKHIGESGGSQKQQANELTASLRVAEGWLRGDTGSEKRRVAFFMVCDGAQGERVAAETPQDFTLAGARLCSSADLPRELARAVRAECHALSPKMAAAMDVFASGRVVYARPGAGLLSKAEEAAEREAIVGWHVRAKGRKARSGAFSRRAAAVSRRKNLGVAASAAA